VAKQNFPQNAFHFDKIYPLIFISHILAKFCTQKKAQNILTEYSFSFYFLHFGEISHPKNNKFTDEIFLYVYLIVTVWQIFALNKTPNMY
jgi:hypothetical protein